MGSRLLTDLKWGWGWAGFFALAYSLWVVVASTLRGSIDWPDVGMTTPTILGVYCLGAFICGAVLGVCRPLTQHRFGAFFVGWLVASCAYGAASILLPDGELWIAPLLGLLGGGMGLVWHDEDQPRQREGAIGPVVQILAALAALVAVIALLSG